jgi:hypothetical protein
MGDIGSELVTVTSDGSNFRVSNQTGCPIASIVTSGGSGYSSVPTVTPSEGGSRWFAILGSTVNSINVVAAGVNYQYPPIVVIQAPPAPGYPATAQATITNGRVTAITMQNVGAGYTTPPSVTLLNDARDNVGSGAAAAPVLGNQGRVTGVACADHYGGAGIASGTVPTLTFSGGGGSGAAAIALMCWTVASVNVLSGGAGFAANSVVGVRSFGNGIPTSPAPYYLNPRMEGATAMLRARDASLAFATSAGGVLTTPLGGDQGIIGGVTSNVVLGTFGGPNPTTAATLAIIPGGQSDVVFLIQN